MNDNFFIENILYTHAIAVCRLLFQKTSRWRMIVINKTNIYNTNHNTIYSKMYLKLVVK